MKSSKTVTVDGIKVEVNGEKNLLEVVRKANIDIPTFCYHSELSIYGACRLCMVDVEGRGLQASCSTPPEAGMVIRTNTEEIREMRKITLELLLASHEGSCPTCIKNDGCKLRALSGKLGIDKVRFKHIDKNKKIDKSSLSLVRDPNKCVLCGDCVRFCSEIQGIGAIDFAHRGADVSVVPAYGKDLAQVECVNCGQCAAVCPTGALAPRQEVEDVWKSLHNKEKVVVAQVAPAVRVAIGEMFGFKPGEITTGQIVSALRMMGFDGVYDTSFAADLTVIEEATEFINRVKSGKKLPQFTSCCPAWVKYAEQYYPSILANLSTCRSPQQMFGSIAKDTLVESMKVKPENLVVVSIMPCTAKKFEAKRDEFTKNGRPDVDHVITTQELGNMIRESGILFENLNPESMDMPFGFTTGAGVIFGNSGGVSEAVLRFAYEKLSGRELKNIDFHEVRGEENLREAEVEIDGIKVRLAVVHGLKNAGMLAEKVKKGEVDYDIIEVMACPGGCIGGAGQPVSSNVSIRQKRKQGLYNADKLLQLHKAQDNPFVKACYENKLGEANSETAHELLHTHYQSRKRIDDPDMGIISNKAEKTCNVKVCLGTSCFLRGSQTILGSLLRYVDDNHLQDKIDVKATFCMEACDKGPSVTVGDKVLHKTTLKQVIEAVENEIAQKV
jgi:NADH-quinone oxidoreductase subunit G